MTRAAPARAAVLDIGSNSIRLVVFDLTAGHPQMLFNEKVLCALGRSLGRTGALAGPDMDRAIAALGRFARLLDAMEIKAVAALATAAVRDADNGETFVADVQARTGLVVEVIPGEEEARLSAMGVIAGLPQARGVVGDLGGGSLELVAVEAGEVFDRVTLPIGAVRLDGISSEAAQQEALIAEALDGVDWLERYHGQSLYVVGGAWRAITRLQLAWEDWPLPILHGFKLKGADAAESCRLIARQHAESLRAAAVVPQRRVEMLPTAARVQAAVIDRLRPDQVVTSAFGLREGVAYDRFVAGKGDPFLQECQEIARRLGRFGDQGHALMRWLDPLFEGRFAETPDRRRLRLAACFLSDIAWRGHPDFRAERAAMEILYGHFVGVDHGGRAYIALALSLCYGGTKDPQVQQMCQRLLSPEEQDAAQRLGLALRLAHRVSGGSGAVLDQTRMCLTNDSVQLVFDPEAAELKGEVVERRLAKLASAFNRDPDLVLL